MPIEYDSKPVIRKRDDDTYELIWNVNNSVLSVLSKDQFNHMVECLKTLAQSEPSHLKDYHFPVMRHTVTG